MNKHSVSQFSPSFTQGELSSLISLTPYVLYIKTTDQSLVKGTWFRWTIKLLKPETFLDKLNPKNDCRGRENLPFCMETVVCPDSADYTTDCILNICHILSVIPSANRFQPFRNKRSSGFHPKRDLKTSNISEYIDLLSRGNSPH